MLFPICCSIIADFSLIQSGETPIHVATRYGHCDVISYLCSVGVDVNKEDKVCMGKNSFIPVQVTVPVHLTHDTH